MSDTDICPEDDFDYREQGVIAFMARQKDVNYRELTGQQMQDLLTEYDDCEKWQTEYACT